MKEGEGERERGERERERERGGGGGGGGEKCPDKNREAVGLDKLVWMCMIVRFTFICCNCSSPPE